MSRLKPEKRPAFRRSGNTTLMRLSSNDEHAQCFNNVVLVTAGTGRLAVLDATGTIDLHHNWLRDGWVDAHGTLEGTLNAWANLTCATPGFADMADQGYHLVEGSLCIDAGGELPASLLPNHALRYQYVRHQRYTGRFTDGGVAMGAFEK